MTARSEGRPMNERKPLVPQSMRGAVVSPAPQFDIYQTQAGYVAVTNEVRRKILDALKDGDLDLPALVKVTKKAKPTLSNLHVKELLEQNLVEELPHPTDARRKLYRLRARRIGSSDVPLDQLRGAVKHYVSLSPLAYAVPFPAVLAALTVEGVPENALRKQAREIGARASALFTAADANDALTAVAGFWDREGIAKAKRIDYDARAVELLLGDACPEGREEATAVVLAGILEGVLRSRFGKDHVVKARVVRPRRVVLELA